MKNKIKEFFKDNKIYTILFFLLLIINLLISTTTYEYTNFSLQLPFKSLYGTGIIENENGRSKKHYCNQWKQEVKSLTHSINNGTNKRKQRDNT